MLCRTCSPESRSLLYIVVEVEFKRGSVDVVQRSGKWGRRQMVLHIVLVVIHVCMIRADLVATCFKSIWVLYLYNDLDNWL
jgi:hypothetical protein